MSDPLAFKWGCGSGAATRVRHAVHLDAKIGTRVRLACCGYVLLRLPTWSCAKCKRCEELVERNGWIEFDRYAPIATPTEIDTMDPRTP